MNEPNYTFVKGTGWVPTYGPCEMVVGERELQVGDVVVGWWYKGSEEMHPAVVDYHITRINGNLIESRETTTFHEIHGMDLRFKVRRV